MTTLWQTFQNDLTKIECENCGSGVELYNLQGGIICRECLEELEYEKETGLTNEERNK